MYITMVIAFYCHAQTGKVEQLKTLYSQTEDYQKETIYLHLPKLVYWQKEMVWFSGYVFKNNATLSAETTNVYCGIYDAFGQEITKAIFYVEDGRFLGQLKIPESYGTGKFYIKAYTQWMKNFSKNEAFIQDLYVINKDFKRIETNTSETTNITIQPEGGCLLSNIENTLSIKLKAKTELNITNCDVLDASGKIVVNNIKLNKSGLGKFNFVPKPNENYQARITIKNGEQLFKALPKVTVQGYTLSINSIFKNKMVVRLNTNAKTLKAQKSEAFYLVVHKKDLHRIINLKIKDTTNIFTIPKSDLKTGINHLTFYDNDLNIIANRIVYNDFNAEYSQIPQVTVVKKKYDSLMLHIKPNTKYAKNDNTHLSVAVLPYYSKSAGVNVSLKDWYSYKTLLNNDEINDLKHYQNNKRQKLFNTDIYLMNINKNTTHNKVKTTNFNYEFEKGFSIVGKINSDKSYLGKTLFVFQQQTANLITTQIKKDNSFRLNALYLITDDELNLSIDKKENLKANNITLSVTPTIKPDTLSSKELTKTTSFTRNSINAVPNDVYDSISPSLLNTTNILEEVVVKAKKKTNMTRNIGLANSVFEAKKVGEKERKKHPKLSTYIRQLGFRVQRNFQDDTFFILGKSLQDRQLPIVYLDGFRTSERLQDFSMRSIDEVYYEHIGLEGSDGGTIYIYTRINYKDNNNAVAKKKIKTGYTLPLPFQYSSLTDYTYKDLLAHGLFYWNGNAKLNTKGSLTIKFPTFNTTKFIVQINGVTENGEIISIEEVINTEN